MKLGQLEMQHKIVNNPIKDYYAYARKSSEAEDRQVASIPDQLNEFKTICASHNLNLHNDHIFSESRSAKAPGRVEFNKLIDEIDNGKVRGIIVWKLNRLFRNPEDEGKIRQRLSDGRIESIITPQKTYYEADSDFIMAVEGAQAQRFIRDLREDTARGIQSKIDKGIAPILAPPGYINDLLKRQGERDIIPSKQFSLVRHLFVDLFLTGNYSVASLHDEAIKLGIKSNRGKIISRTQLYEMLRNPFYTGTRFIYAGKLYTNGTHKRMITDEEFDRIQDIMTGNSHPRGQVRHDLLTGLIKCGECGRSITSEVKHKKLVDGTVNEHIYYRCTKKNRREKNCNQHYIKAEHLEEQALDFLAGLELSPKFTEWAIKWLNETHKENTELREAKYQQTEQAYREVVSKIDRLVDVILAGIITPQEGSLKKLQLEEEKQRLSDELIKLNTHVSEWSDLTIKTFDFVKNIREKFANGTPDERKTILRVIGSNLVLKDKILSIEVRTPFKYVREIAAQIVPGSRLKKGKSVRSNQVWVEDGTKFELPSLLTQYYSSIPSSELDFYRASFSQFNYASI